MLLKNKFPGSKWSDILMLIKQSEVYDLTIGPWARVFYKQIVNEAQPSLLSLVENEGE